MVKPLLTLIACCHCGCLTAGDGRRRNTASTCCHCFYRTAANCVHILPRRRLSQPCLQPHLTGFPSLMHRSNIYYLLLLCLSSLPFEARQRVTIEGTFTPKGRGGGRVISLVHQESRVLVSIRALGLSRSTAYPGIVDVH